MDIEVNLYESDMLVGTIDFNHFLNYGEVIIDDQGIEMKVIEIVDCDYDNGTMDVVIEYV